MSKFLDLPGIIDAYLRVAREREATKNEAWNYGWSQSSYRHSANAAITGIKGRNVRLTPSGVILFEEATSSLLNLQQIQRRYDIKEFWSLAASMIGALPIHNRPDELRQAIDRWLETLLNPPDSLTVFAVANVAKLENILDLGPLVLGQSSNALKRALQQKIGREVSRPPASDVWWVSDFYEPEPAANSGTTLFAYRGQSQLEQAIKDAGEAFENLISIALMLQPDLNALSLYSLRGDANRPGLRGLVPDRESLTKTAQNLPEVSREIGCPILIDGVFGQTMTLHWYSENSFPLETLLAQPEKRAATEKLLLGSTAVHRRLRVAARWHAKAHWSFEPADAVLALGISFDSMLSEKSPSPGRILSERFALIDPDGAKRRERYRLFQTEYYPARSSVAHGAMPESLDAEFVRGMAKQARSTFQEILRITDALAVASEDQYNNMWESMRWDGPGLVPGRHIGQ